MFTLFDNYVNSALKIVFSSEASLSESTLSYNLRHERAFIEGLRYYSNRNYEHRLSIDIH